MTECNVAPMPDSYPEKAEGATSKASAVISVRVPRAVHARIMAVVEAEGITLGDWTRDALLNAVRRAERNLRRAAD